MVSGFDIELFGAGNPHINLLSLFNSSKRCIWITWKESTHCEEVVEGRTSFFHWWFIVLKWPQLGHLLRVSSLAAVRLYLWRRIVALLFSANPLSFSVRWIFCWRKRRDWVDGLVDFASSVDRAGCSTCDRWELSWLGNDRYSCPVQPRLNIPSDQKGWLLLCNAFTTHHPIAHRILDAPYRPDHISPASCSHHWFCVLMFPGYKGPQCTFQVFWCTRACFHLLLLFLVPVYGSSPMFPICFTYTVITLREAEQGALWSNSVTEYFAKEQWGSISKLAEFWSKCLSVCYVLWLLFKQLQMQLPNFEEMFRWLFLPSQQDVIASDEG